MINTKALDEYYGAAAGMITSLNVEKYRNLRFECLKLARETGNMSDPDKVLETANSYFNFVMITKPDNKQ